MTRKCTDPERWDVVPGSDADENEVEAYLAHTRECPFHAAIENRDRKMVETMVAIARSKSRGSDSIRPWQWTNLESAFRPAMMLVIIIALALLLTTLLPKRPEQIAERRDGGPQPEKPEPGEQPPGPDRQDLIPKPAAGQKRTPRSQERKLQNPVVNHETAAESPELLERIYVGSGFDPELRQALNNSFQSRGIALVESEEQAGTILRAEPTRGEEVIVELMSRSHGRLWWMSAKTSGDSSIGVEELAERIVSDLFKQVERAGTRPQPR